MFPYFRRAARKLLRTREVWEPSVEAESDWEQRKLDYADWWDWFDGEKLEELDRETVNKDGKNPPKYPLKINLVKPACQLHAYALAGEVPDTSDPIVKTKAEPPSKSGRGLADEATDILAQVAYDNNMRDLDMQQFLACQATGGSVWQVTWDPNDPMLSLGVRWETIPVEEFWCTWQGTNHFNLTNAWVKRTISKETAAAYGAIIDSDTAEYLEHWDKRDRHITIDGQPAKNPATGDEMMGPHGLGWVPLVYIPHHRAKEFWGYSLVPDVIGITEEFNSRMADMGDALRLGVHRNPWYRNVNPGFPSAVTLPNGEVAFNLGTSIGQRPPPEIGRMERPDVPAGMDSFMGSLHDMARIAQVTPSIAYGEEEGSQRSGQTLYSRMWPQLAHVRFERGWWTIGKNLMARMTLKILAQKGRGGITQEHTALRCRQLWSEMLPVDRAALVREIVQRRSAGLISQEHAMELLGDVPDVEKEIGMILEWERQMAELRKARQPSQTSGAGSDGGEMDGE